MAPIFTRDAAGNEAHAALDYRVLQPHCLTDPNGNRAEARFDALGMLAGTVLRGKTDGPVEGDSFDDFVTDLTPAEIRAYFDMDNPRERAIAHLGTATTRNIYQLHRVPSCAAAIARETHVSALAPGDQTRVQLQFSYSDGFGRIAQTKIQAEPGPLDPGRNDSPTADPRWVGTGATIYNNKGKPVRQYEPFFSATPQFGIERWGVSNVLFYDPIERVIATLHPDHTFEKVIIGPWRQVTYDANDTALLRPEADPDVGANFRLLPVHDYLPTWYQQRIDGGRGPREKEAAEKAARHADTPTSVCFDSLGRSILSIANNGRNADGELRLYITRTLLDIEGNQREVIDALGRTVMRYDYDMVGTRLRQHSMEAGERWLLNDVAGKPLRIWNSRNYVLRMEYDELRRPTRNFVRGGLHEPHQQYFADDCLFSRTIYGDSEQTGLTEAQRRESNLRAKPYRHFDGAGMATTGLYDFKGNALTNMRQFATEYREAPDWARHVELEFAIFTSATEYDALNRVSAATAPDGSIYRPKFNDASLLEAVDVNIRGARDQGRPVWSPFVRHINYDAKGQRAVVEYGNGAATYYFYEPNTLRLSRMKTERKSGPAAAARIFKNPAVIQDLHYTYDPVGNIIRISDAALETEFHANSKVDAAAEYTYDPIYRLLAATGREHATQSAFSFAPSGGNYRDFPFVGAAQLHDTHALQNYEERYEYDSVGNIVCLCHEAPGNHFGRTYSYDSPSLLEPRLKNNRLSQTTLRAGPLTLTERYRHDAHGNMTQMPHLPHMAWDFQDRLRRTSRQIVNEATPEETFYVYDAAGQRARKITLRQDGGRKNERYYLGGFETFRAYDAGGVAMQRDTLHVMDDKRRISLIETCTIEHGKAMESPASVKRYQLANHLGSSALELDGRAELLTYEEYSPYGNSTFQVGGSAEVSLKRYRYTGKERDKENGFTYHGARYYAPWLGRWTAGDPSGLKDGPNLYAYVRNNPIILHDPSGRAGEAKSVSAATGDLILYADKVANRASVGANIQKDHAVSQKILKTILGPLEKLYKSGRDLTTVVETGAATSSSAARWHTVKSTLEKPVQALFEGLAAQGKAVTLEHVAEEMQAVLRAANGTATLTRQQYLAMLSQFGNMHATASLKDTGKLASLIEKGNVAGLEKAVDALAKSTKGVAKWTKVLRSIATSENTAAAATRAASAASKLAKFAKAAAPVAKFAGRAAGAVGVVVSAVQVFTAKTTDERVDAGIGLVGNALLTSENPVAMAAGGGVLAGQYLEHKLNVSEFSSQHGIDTKEFLEKHGAGETTAFVGGAVVAVVSTPFALGEAIGTKLASWL